MNKKLNIVRTIEKNPGIKFRELMREIDVKNGVLSFHVKKLEENGSIKVERTSGTTRFYPLGIENEETVLIKYLRQKISRKIIILLIRNKYLSYKNLVKMTQVPSSNLSKYLSRLRSDCIVNTKFEKRTLFYEIKKEDVVKRVISRYRHDLLSSDHRKVMTLLLPVFFSLSQRLISDNLFSGILDCVF